MQNRTNRRPQRTKTAIATNLLITRVARLSHSETITSMQARIIADRIVFISVEI